MFSVPGRKEAPRLEKEHTMGLGQLLPGASDVALHACAVEAGTTDHIWSLEELLGVARTLLFEPPLFVFQQPGDFPP